MVGLVVSSAACLSLVALLFMAVPVAAIPLEGPSTVPLPPEGIPQELRPAVDALQKGDAQTALTLARAFVKPRPDSAVGHEVLGEAAMRRLQWVEAERALSEALRLEPRRASAMVRLGQVRLAMRDGKKAEAHFRQAIATHPRLGAAHRGLASALAREGRLQEAIASAQEALRVSSWQDVEAKFLLASFHHDAGQARAAEQLLTEILVAQPEWQPALLLQAMVKLDLGKTDEAAALLDRVARRDPTSVWARFGLAVLQRTRGQLPQARNEFEKIIRERPDWATPHFQLAHTLLLQKQPEAALKAFGAAEQASGDASQSRLRAVRVLLATRHADLAIDHARPLLGVPTTAAAARSLMVQGHLIKGNPEQAERVLADAVAGAPQDPTARMQLGRFWLQRGRAKDALLQFDRVVAARPDSVDALIAKAEAHAALGEAPAAVSTAERLLKVQNQSPASYLFLAAIHQRLRRTSDAEKAYRQVLAREPNHLGATRGLARLYESQRRTADAINLLQAAARAHPAASLPLVELAQIHERAGNVPAAVLAYREALARSPEEPLVLNNLAVLLSKDQATLTEAVAVAERAHRSVPRNGAIADTLGWLLYQQGALDRATPLLEQAARSAPGNPQIQYHLGVAYARQGKRAEARRALEQALQGEGFPEAGEARRLLGSLR